MATRPPVVVGIDIGTQSLKAVVTDGELSVLGEAAVPYQPRFPRPLWAEQDPDLWLRALAPAVAGALERAGARPEDALALGIGGQLDGCVPVDPACEPLGPAIIWMDRRAERETRDVPAERILERAGVILDSTHMAAKARWWKRHGGRPARRFHQPVSFVVERLCGRAVMDHALASTSMVYDLRSRALANDLLALFDLDADELPEVDEATAEAGRLGAEGARLTGLPPGLPVVVGTGDDFANALGCGVVEAGTVVCALGTAEVVGAVHSHPVIDRGRLVETHGYAGGRCFVENPGWLSGGALAWFVRAFNLADVASLGRAAADAPPGCDGLTFLPALSGAMAPEWIGTARAGFHGLTATHGTAHMARAVLEGCAFAMRDVVDRLDELGIRTDRILALGGGARSRLWTQIRADLTGRPVGIAAVTDGAPLGAALLAAVCCGAQPSLDAAAARVGRTLGTRMPDSANAAVYDEAYRRYRSLFAALRPLFLAAGEETSL
jgi:xylulokinase